MFVPHLKYYKASRQPPGDSYAQEKGECCMIRQAEKEEPANTFPVFTQSLLSLVWVKVLVVLHS